MLEKECLSCHRMFKKSKARSLKDWNTRSKYCSIACKYPRKITLLCKTCCKVFEVKNYRKETALYCSKKCACSSSEKRKKMSDFLKKNPILIRNNNYVHSEETRLKMSRSRLGKIPHNKKPDCFITCCVCGAYKKVPPAYKNSKLCSRRCAVKNRDKGKTSEAKKIRTSKEYNLWRMAVFKRDNFTCVICNIRNVRLNADHIKRFADYPELRLDINNGRTLCESCHKKTSTYGNKKQIIHDYFSEG